MGVLSGLEPANVFRFFEEIAGIPHGSGNVDRISDYLADFARERGLFCIQDAVKNIIIIKEATPGYEDQPALILQGHMDMVAVKTPDCPLDMEKDGLQLMVEGDSVFAQGTSLGADNGIAVAYCLAFLEDEEICHPRLEVVITVDEETGLEGAREIDLSGLLGRRMLNMDSEDEGVFTVSCAGGLRADCAVSLETEIVEGEAWELVLDGLQGGHSGCDIHKEGGNSNCLIARALGVLSKEVNFCLQSLEGGFADNAIPRATKACIVLREADAERMETVLDKVADEIREELAVKDPGVRLSRSRVGKGSYRCVTSRDTVKALNFLNALPNGILSKSAEIEGLVETSLNLGRAELLFGEVAKEQFPGAELHAQFALRSSVESQKYALLDRLSAVVGLVGGTISVAGDYPGWKYNAKSPLREKMCAVYEKMYGSSPRVEAIHAGLECGILGSKIEGLDCVAMGPDLKNVHTTEESFSISSVARVWEYLVKLLEEKDC